MLGVFSHEVVHTRQLEAVDRRVDELKRRYALPEKVDDDIVENRFKDVPGFREAHDGETDLFYAAASEADSARRRELVAKALALVRARQSRYFTGSDEVYRELEELFLNMEGVAVWASFKLSQIDPRFDIGIKDPVIQRARNTWSQDEGLALFLLIDSMVPDWREHVLGPSLASPFALLEEAVGTRARQLARRAGPALPQRRTEWRRLDRYSIGHCSLIFLPIRQNNRPPASRLIRLIRAVSGGGTEDERYAQPRDDGPNAERFSECRAFFGRRRGAGVRGFTTLARSPRR